MKKPIFTLIIILFAVYLSLNWSCSRGIYPNEPENKYNDEDLSLEISAEWDRVQSEDTLIATMLTQSLALLMMENESENSPVLMRDVGLCFYGLLWGDKSSSYCTIPIKLLKPICPCPDPRKDCDPSWFPTVYTNCIVEALRCRVENSLICQGSSLGGNPPTNPQDTTLRQCISKEWGDV